MFEYDDYELDENSPPKFSEKGRDQLILKKISKNFSMNSTFINSGVNSTKEFQT